MLDNWETLSQDEKIEALKDGLMDLQSLVTTWIQHQQTAGVWHNQLMKKHGVTEETVLQAARAVEALELKVAAFEIGRKP